MGTGLLQKTVGGGGAEKVDVASSGKVLRPASSNIAPTPTD